MSHYQFATFTFDASRGELHELAQGPVPLRNKVGRLLEYLLKHRNRLVTKEELLENLWQHGDYRENSLTQSIRELRKVLGDRAQSPRYIKTFPQRGYQWICPLSPDSTADPEHTSSSRDQSPASTTASPLPCHRASQRRLVLGAVAFTLALSVLVASVLLDSRRQAGTSEQTPRLLVLPFFNETGDADNNWVELGLSDMLATSIQRTGEVTVAPPTVANTLLLSAGLEWPTLPMHIRALLLEEGYQQALLASVRTEGDFYVLDYQLVLADGGEHRGAIRYPSLPNASEAIARQLVSLLAPSQKGIQIDARGDPTVDLIADASSDLGLARQALAQGMGAMQTQGPKRGDEYFQAASLLDKQDPWIKASRAKSQLLLGHWSSAHQHLSELQQTQGADLSLDAFRQYWEAELAYRQGDDKRAEQWVTRAIDAAEQSRNIQVMADSYRLRARIAWSERQWDTHREWLRKADALSPRDGDLRIEAEKLFYLGNSISQGLEKDPQADLLLNRERLLKALNYYTRLGNQPMIAASHFALAQNYTLDLPTRQASLETAIDLYETLEQPYELAEVLAYASFFHLQLREGAQAEVMVERARQVIDPLGRHRLEEELRFYRAFAVLDQGLDQRHRGKHGSDPEKLKQAVRMFEELIRSSDSMVTETNALVMLGWAHADLKHYDRALTALSKARDLSNELAMATTSGYATYGMMRVHLAKENYAGVIELGKAPVTTRQQLGYLARAHYELAEYGEAVKTQELLKNRFPELWSEADRERLSIYREAGAHGETGILEAEAPAHSVYCESDWMFKG